MEFTSSFSKDYVIFHKYAGPLGIIQSLADGIKLLLKEDIIPTGSNAWLFTIGPAIVVIPVFLTYLVIPFGQNIILANLNIGVFFWIAISSVVPLGLLMSGYGSNNKYSFLGGLRAAAQSISYEIPLALCILSISLQCERLPFDLPEAEEELVAGYQTEYSGIKFALFYVGSYLNLLISSLFVTILYLGGWKSSIPFVENFIQNISINYGINESFDVLKPVLDIFTTLSKSYLFLFISILTRRALPRVRIDQLLDLGWKFLLPIALGNLLLTASFQILSIN
ncbi:hypothetical protein KP509_01G080700 [Ceratopteris richardii]|uniref:NADH-plastoquinone oxidoreductase subunit 1 n=1 Tax=Ceratopteris richardii TaxID=49495 RepID=A0A8T2VEL2_CERRI|nr:hypothetical protein KP509_01G080700 [Ceratopteris richardii]